VDTYYGDFQEFSDSAYDYFDHHYGHYPNSDQDEWLQLIWETFQENGWIDWEKTRDGAWWFWMTEVLGFDPELIENYIGT